MNHTENLDTVYRYALYIGSFPVEGAEHHGRTVKVHKELETLRTFTRSKNVLLCVSVSGIKVCSVDRKIVYMAHALRRISYATCDAAYKQVVFLAREPMGEATLQYCHVFITGTCSLAEELNRIIGDAFQLAFIKQRMAKIAAQGDSDADSTGPIPRLSDWHEPWPSSTGTLNPNTNNNALIGILELPPPPSYPPPPASDTGVPSDPGFSKDVQNIGNNGLGPSSKKVQPMEDRFAHNDFDAQAYPPDRNIPEEHNSADELEPQLNTISNVNAPAFGGFRRRHFLRMSEGAKRFSGISDAQIVGGSTRQPKRRQDRGLASLFSSSRHSSFFPNTGSSKEPNVPDLLELLSAQNSPPKPHIFLDLRTFAGGSPVVALKERLDAQAVADAKACAFAEAAAVLAAAKEATGGPNNAESLIGGPPRTDIQSGSPGSYPVTSTSPCSTNSTHSEPSRPIVDSNGSVESPPTPPIRIHSLRRISTHRSTSCGRDQAPSSTEEAPLVGNRSSNDTDTRTTVAPFSSDCDKQPRKLSAHTQVVRIDGGRAKLKQRSSGNEANELRAANRPQPSRRQSSPWNSTICAMDDVDTQNWIPQSHNRRTRHGNQQLRINDKRSSRSQDATAKHSSQHHCPNGTNGSTRSPLHVVTVADSLLTRVAPVTSHGGCRPNDASIHSGYPQSQPAPHNVMSTSTFSTETPTPTATPTPTPTQNHQSATEHVTTPYAPVAVTGDDVEFLKHAPWYQAMVPREIAFELLAREEAGSFLVRNSVSHPDCCALSVRVPFQENPSGITHYLIQRTLNGVKLKGLDKEWPSLRALITHLTVIPEMLPCPLRLPAHNFNPVFTNADEHLDINRMDRNACSTNSQYLPDRQITRRDLRGSTTEPFQSAASLPSRPVPPSCASRSYLSTSSSSATPVQNNQLPRQSSEINGHSAPYTNTGSRNVSADVLRERKFSLPGYQAIHRVAHVDAEGRDSQQGSFVIGRLGVQEEEEDEDYQRLSDFSSILADLELTTDREIPSC
ncbi:hypothetical protein CSKR_106816 [Clonorchis sinensis]|uniref:Tensin-4 n=1 Tax=Clonorchis sinensis TaxID=79923 RepID=A0A8T1MF65_CLOSI|nr:hypothetical protein CSKR_106816 [Clonorchis sinensis]